MTRPSDVEVSVIIPVRGSSVSLAVQLSVLAAQLKAPSFVLVLVDNGRNGDLRGGRARQMSVAAGGGTLESAAWV